MSTRDLLAQTKAQESKAVPIALNLIIFTVWLWLYRSLFAYFAVIFSNEDFRTNQLVLIGVIILIATQVQRGKINFQLDAPPRLFPLGLSLAIGSSLLYLLVERFLDINTISASLFGIASYGLLGLWISPSRWRQGIPAVLLLIGTLPFGEHMQTFIGYPMRILTASLVRDGLSASGIASLGVDTILILENGVSQVDLPCSGVKSLWTGALFLIAATWIERRPVNWRWLFTGLVFTVLLFIANLLRVAILVLVGQVAGWHLAAQMLHVPLGVLGFIAACAAAVMLLRRTPPQPHDSASASPAPFAAPTWLPVALITAILLMALLYTARPQTGLAAPSQGWQFPAGLAAEPMPLRPDERQWLTRDGAQSADRYRFQWQDISGSMILISSDTWRAHHRPERCFEVYGLTLEESTPYLINPELPIRMVSLGDSQGRSLQSAAYWFQSASSTTNDYAKRMWADLPPNRERWVLVSILFDGTIEPSSTDVHDFYTALHQAVALDFNSAASSGPEE